MVSSATLLSEVILFVRDRLRANITDPISTERPSGEKFVMTAYPRRDVSYPIITVRGEVTDETKLGQQSEASQIKLAIEVRIWARNEKEKNNLHDEIYEFMRTNQYPTGTSNTSTNENLFDFGLDFAKDLDDPGEEGVKSKLTQYRFGFFT